MFLYLVRPESSRMFCCKVYKWIGVVFRWFFPGVLRELSRKSVVFTEVRRRSRENLGGFVKYRRRSCLLKCILNREVTCIWQEAVFIRGWWRSSVVTSLAWACPGTDPGEVKWVNFHPPFSEPPSFFFSFLSSNIEIILDFSDIITKIHPPISKSWIRPCCCEVLCGITAFVWNKLFWLCFDIPAFCLDNKLPTTTLKHQTCNKFKWAKTIH